MCRLYKEDGRTVANQSCGSGRRIELLRANESDFQEQPFKGKQWECAQLDTFFSSQLLQHPPEQGFHPEDREITFLQNVIKHVSCGI
jgi:hypothetical protein